MSPSLVVSHYIVVLFLLSCVPGIAHAADSSMRSPSARPSSSEQINHESKNSCKDQRECVELIKRARDLENAKSNSEALDVYKDAYNTFNDMRILLRIGLLLNKLERYSQAMEILTRYVESETDASDSPLMRLAKDGIAEAEQRRLRDVTLSIYKYGSGSVRVVNNAFSCSTKLCSFQLHNVAQSPLTSTTLVAEPTLFGSTVSWSFPCRTTEASPNECLLTVYKDTSVQVQFKRSALRTAVSIVAGVGAAVSIVTGTVVLAKSEMQLFGPGTASLGLGGGLGALSLSLALM